VVKGKRNLKLLKGKVAVRTGKSKWPTFALGRSKEVIPLFSRWVINPKNEELAKKKANELITIYKNLNYCLNSRVFIQNNQYRNGFLAELEFCDSLKQKGIDVQYLNEKPNPDGDDNGDFIINGKKVDLKTQSYNNGSINPYWTVNLNLNSYLKDGRKGIEIFSFLFWNPLRKELTFVGNIDYEDVPKLGFLVKAGDDFGNGMKCSSDCYNIRIDKLRMLV
jgi:hypothetical protein